MCSLSAVAVWLSDKLPAGFVEIAGCERGVALAAQADWFAVRIAEGIAVQDGRSRVAAAAMNRLIFASTAAVNSFAVVADRQVVERLEQIVPVSGYYDRHIRTGVAQRSIGCIL